MCEKKCQLDLRDDFSIKIFKVTESKYDIRILKLKKCQSEIEKKVGILF